jgi:hypothetical protein
MGTIEISRRKAEVVVLDGQHRANAFRFLSGDLDVEDTIYATFYQGLGAANEVDADLPVTLIWFEAGDTGA